MVLYEVVKFKGCFVKRSHKTTVCVDKYSFVIYGVDVKHLPS